MNYRIYEHPASPLLDPVFMLIELVSGAAVTVYSDFSDQSSADCARYLRTVTRICADPEKSRQLALFIVSFAKNITKLRTASRRTR